MADVEKIAGAPRHGPVTLHQVRLDLGRNTGITVQRNVNGHVYVTLGSNDATLIIHPHAAKRLLANMTAVLDGADFTYD